MLGKIRMEMRDQIHSKRTKVTITSHLPATHAAARVWHDAQAALEDGGHDSQIGAVP